MSDAPHVASLTILAGPLKGHVLPVEDAVDDLLVGSDPDCRLVVNLPGVSPIHARIWLDPDGATVYNTRSARGVYVNDSPVEDQAPLRDGDILWLGAPGEPDSVMIQFRHRISAPRGAAGAAAPAALGKAEAEAELIEVDPTPVAAGDDWLIEELEAGAPAAPALARGHEHDEPAAVDDGFFVDEPAPAPAPPAPIEADADGFFFEAASEPTHSAAPASDSHAFVFDEAEAAPAPAPRPRPTVADDMFVIDEELAPAVAAPPAPLPKPPPAAQPKPPPAAQPQPPPAPPPAPPVAIPPRVPDSPSPPPAPPEAASPRVRPPADRPERGPRPGRPTASAARSPAGRGGLKWVALGVGALVLVAVGVVATIRLTGRPRVDSVEPARARVGDHVILRGRRLSPRPEGNLVRFGGEREGQVLTATAEQLEVEVPEFPLPPGGSKQVPVALTSNGVDAGVVEITLFQAPRLHGISPSVAMPGEEVVLAGTGWGSTVRVTFGTLEATLLEVTESSIRVQVPPAAPPTQGTSLPVTVASGNDASNPAPFVIGRLPLLTSIEPGTAAPGDVLTVRGRGFPLQAGWNDLRVGGVRALVASAVESELKVVVPWVEGPGGPVAVELRVPGSENVGMWTVTLPAPGDAVAFRFSASRLEDAPGHDHVALTTPLGPVFVISGAGGHSAADRAVVYLHRLNEAAVPLKASVTSDLETRGLDAQPSIGLVGNPQALLEVTDEDAAAYEESWAGPRGRDAGTVTAERLATWWGAVARDLMLLLVRGEKPRYAVALAPEGRALAELYDAARNTGRFGLPVVVLGGLKPPQREALRALVRLPAALRSSARAPAAGAAALPLPGIWSGWESEAGEHKYVTLNFTATGGTLTYERALSLTLPLLSVEQPRRGILRYALQGGARARYYEGTWDGQKVRGRIFSDPERTTEVGAFELERKR